MGYDEDTLVGPHIFKTNISEHHPVIPNRSLFLEYCGTHKLVVSNSMFDYPDELLVTYHNLNSKPSDNIANGAFSQLDYVLCPEQSTDMIYDCKTDRRIALRSHHFIMIAAVRISFVKEAINKNRQKSIQSLRDVRVRDDFYTAFTTAIPNENMSIPIWIIMICMT